jgi:hypothetical protein
LTANPAVIPPLLVNQVYSWLRSSVLFEQQVKIYQHFSDQSGMKHERPRDYGTIEAITDD